MKKTLMFAFAAATMLMSCGGNSTNADAKIESDSTAVSKVECVASGDVVYVDLDYIMASSKLYSAEGRALEEKVQAFQQKMAKTQEDLAKREQALASEYNKLQNDAAKLQDDYSKGLITTLNAQQKQEELQRKGESIQSRMASLEATVQSEGTALQTEEQQLGEEQMVLMNKFQDLTRRAINEINGDKRYKMILNAVSVVDAEPTLNISDVVLEKVDALYDADKAAEEK